MTPCSSAKPLPCNRSPRPSLQILDDEQSEPAQIATLEILEQVGRALPSEKALKIYAEHGAQVDFATQIVRLPPELVLDAMAHAPRFYTMGARSPAHDINLDGKATLSAPPMAAGWRRSTFITRQRRLLQR